MSPISSPTRSMALIWAGRKRRTSANAALQPRRQQVKAHAQVLHALGRERQDGLFHAAPLFEPDLNEVNETSGAVLSPLAGADEEPEEIEDDSEGQNAGQREQDPPAKGDATEVNFHQPFESVGKEIRHGGLRRSFAEPAADIAKRSDDIAEDFQQGRDLADDEEAENEHGNG
jgi:hypothetical protein